MRYEYSLQKPGIAVENIDVLDISREKNYRYSYRNGRIKHGFIYIAKGAMRDVFENDAQNPLYAQANDLLFIPKNCAYTSTYLEEETQIKIVQFDLSAGTLPVYLSEPCKIDLPNAGELMDAFFKPVHNQVHGHPFYYLACFYNLLWNIDQTCTSIPTQYKKLRNALKDLSVSYVQNEKIAYYAALCGISEPNFRKLFHRYTGMSPVEYRNELRLNDARIKLQSGEYNVSEAAEAAGFSNLSFFIRLYKKKFGHTPKKE